MEVRTGVFILRTLYRCAVYYIIRQFILFVSNSIFKTNQPKVIWEQGRVAPQLPPERFYNDGGKFIFWRPADIVQQYSSRRKMDSVMPQLLLIGTPRAH